MPLTRQTYDKNEEFRLNVAQVFPSHPCWQEDWNHLAPLWVKDNCVEFWNSAWKMMVYEAAEKAIQEGHKAVIIEGYDAYRHWLNRPGFTRPVDSLMRDFIKTIALRVGRTDKTASIILNGSSDLFNVNGHFDKRVHGFITSNLVYDEKGRPRSIRVFKEKLNSLNFLIRKRRPIIVQEKRYSVEQEMQFFLLRKASILVRIGPELQDRLSGRTPDFDSENTGSSPVPASN